jgi:hypothetical protein
MSGVVAARTGSVYPAEPTISDAQGEGAVSGPSPAQRLFRDHRAALARAVRSDALFPTLSGCSVDSTDSACLPRISEVLYSALARFSQSLLTDRQAEFTGLTSREEILAYRSDLHAIYAATQDRLSRLSALVLLHAAKEVGPTSADTPPQPNFQPAVYRALRGMTAPEAELLLEPRVSAPSDAAAARELVDIAVDAGADGRIRIAAVGALGNSLYGAFLSDVARGIGKAGSEHSALLNTRALPTALADCRKRCSLVLAELMNHTNPTLRWTARTALGLLSDTERDEFFAHAAVPESAVASFRNDSEFDVSHHSLSLQEEQ